MTFDVYRIILTFISRLVAKFFLFLALSVGTPAVNAMRSLEEREPVVIVMENSFRRRDRSLVRRFGYQPEMRFVRYLELSNTYVGI